MSEDWRDKAAEAGWVGPQTLELEKRVSFEAGRQAGQEQVMDEWMENSWPSDQV